MKMFESEKSKFFYSLDEILKTEAHYYMIFGERSNGKTFALQSYALWRYVESGRVEDTAVIRRFDEDFKSQRGSKYFNGLVSSGAVEYYTDGEFTGIEYRQSAWYLTRYDEDLKKTIYDRKPFAYKYSLNTMEHDKSTSQPDVGTVIFDEFTSRRGYLNQEYVVFLNVLSTIIRRKDNVKVFMLGNTVDQYCSYFDDYGVKVKEMSKGDIRVIRNRDVEDNIKRITVAEYTTSGEEERVDTNSFMFDEDNSRTSMITTGDWETGTYPHLPCKYDGKDIALTYFIDYKNMLFQCEIITFENQCFTYIHIKTSKLQNKATDYIFSPEQRSDITWSRRITNPSNKLEKFIYKFFQDEKVFYQNNAVGELIRGYLLWCNSREL